MIFSKSQRFKTDLNPEQVEESLLEKHTCIRDLDFKVHKLEGIIKVIPHTERSERADKILTIPITHVLMEPSGQGTNIKIYSKIRKSDVGGPYMILIFTVVFILGALALYYLNRQGSLTPSLVLGGIGVVLFVVFWIRMENGYFTYVRRIRKFIKDQLK